MSIFHFDFSKKPACVLWIMLMLVARRVFCDGFPYHLSRQFFTTQPKFPAVMTEQCLAVEWVEECNSTQDELKIRIEQLDRDQRAAPGVFAVGALTQRNGRGTRGRSWEGARGNLFLSIAVPFSGLPCPLTLTPLRIGSLLAPEIRQLLPATDQHGVSLKWPNDVLINEKKVAGILIEAELPYLLIGIGINVAFAPAISNSGANRGRPAVCLSEYGVENSDQVVKELGNSIFHSIATWYFSGNDSASEVINSWEQYCEWGKNITIRDTGENVTTIGLERDGRLRVRGTTGEEKILVTEYLL